MKIKELKKNVNMCWSPREHAPVMLATGTAAQQIDASFNSTSSLDIYTLNLQEPGYDLECKSNVQTQHKFQKLVWSGAEVIVGGCDGGLLQFYSSEKLLNNSPDSLLSSNSKHSGQVSALDVNPYQKNLLSSGGAESEIFIWDLHHPAQPMAPGTRSQPHDQVQALAWNHQVQHILGSTFTTRCVVWDLRKNEPIMKLSDSDSRSQWGALCWHPSVATQLVVASKDDHTPVIQLWDLRLASSPLVSLSGHSRGVLSLSWCSQDPGLLLSGGRDGRTLVWNPNNTNPGGELLWEVSSESEWVSEVSWCPRVPALLLAGRHLHALLGGAGRQQSSQSQSNILESFGDASLGALPQVSPAVPHVSPALPMFPKPPAWLKRPVHAKFAFGGKLVSFEKCSPEPGTPKLIYISQVVSDPTLVQRAAVLDDIVTATRDDNADQLLADICLREGDASTDQTSRYLWFFLRANFMPDFTQEALNLLGYKPEEMQSKLKSNAEVSGSPTDNNVDNITSALQAVGLSRGESTETEAELSTDTSTDLSDANTLLERKLANVEEKVTAKNVVIPNGEDVGSAVCRALVCGHLRQAVDLCVSAGRIADALLIAAAGGPELILKVQKYHLCTNKSDPISLLTGGVLLSQWAEVIESCDCRSWRPLLAALLTHTHARDLRAHCELLGDRLVRQNDPSLFEAAIICYVCAANPSALLDTWRTQHRDRTALAQLALLAKRVASTKRPERQVQDDVCEGVVREVAEGLAAQGALHSALGLLHDRTHTPLARRLAIALGAAQHTGHQYDRRTRTTTPHASHYANAAPAPYEQQPGWNSQPPRPGSVGPQTGGISSRSKYKVDPSVQSAPLYGQYSFSNPVTSQPAYSAEQFGVPQPGLVGPLNPTTTLNPILNNQAPQVPGVTNGAYLGRAQDLPAPPAPLVKPAPPAPPGWNDPPPVVAKHKRGIAEGDMCARHAGTRPWEQFRRRARQPEVESQPAPAPITHPLFGAEPQHVPLHTDIPQNTLYPQNSTFPPQNTSFPPQNTSFPPQNTSFPPPNTSFPPQNTSFSSQNTSFPPQNTSFPQNTPYSPQNSTYVPQNASFGQQNVPYVPTNTMGYDPNSGSPYQQQSAQPYAATNYQQQPQQVVQQAAPAVPEVPRPPLSEAHRQVQDALDTLHDSLYRTATTTQIKRKLEDVARRLDCLYDVLRDGKLSESGERVVESLAACVRAGDVGGAWSLAATLAGGHDFAVAAGFLPGLKSLLQLAHSVPAH